MSVKRWVALLTHEEFESARNKAYFGEDWFHNCRSKDYFDFGDARDDVPNNVLDEIAVLNLKVDDVVALLTFLFLQGSESQQLDMFERFLTANLGKSKIVHFWSE